MAQNNDQPDSHRTTYYKSQKKELDGRIKLEKKIRQEVAANESMQTFFAQFNPESVNRYIDKYINEKTGWLAHGKTFARWRDQNELQWMEQAWQHLEVIQHKKLFDAQCLWRAGKVHFDEVEIYFDFEVWGKNVLNCPFIEPITEDDIALYSQFLRTVETDDEYFDSDWQNHYMYKGREEDEFAFELPEWYTYENLYRGKELLILPDLRGDREENYRKLAINQRMEKEALERAANPPTPPADPRPPLNSYDETYNMEWFVKTFEQKEDVKLFEAMQWWDGVRQNEESFEEALKLLVEANEPIPIEAHSDFREAIVLAAAAFKARSVAEALPKAFDEYTFRREAGLPFDFDEMDFEEMKSLRKSYTSQIITGRKLLGEPGNLKYWES